MGLCQITSQLADCNLVQGLIYVALGVGILKLTTLGLSTATLILDLFILPAKDLKTYGAKKDSWAVITGASDGIGKEYSLQLASKGFNIVLVSRTQSKLELLATDIESKYKVKTKVIAFDVSTDDEANYTQIKEVVSKLPVTVLINNVGRSHSIPTPFLETEDSELRNIITINNTATLKITQAVAPSILETVKAKKDVRGLIVTMGSFGGLFPTSYLATYSGSKAFLQSWSAGLAGELRPQGVDVELVLSYLVTSAMSKIRRTSATIPDPASFVSSTLKSLGRRGGAQDRFATCTPYWTHALMHFAVENTVGVYSKVANSINLSMHRSIRARALKKAARNAKSD
ncbi:Piso0_001570 [Millerozyma farinosa CBS 7064]|uniref:Very-long-chain 3-oxoacyl-CoA reductase n=1 Tax=Pichia sorbitophila (strain ATCC MYA-4447 / BCRC 22081 / CBS 7064 / NBRC 10061 / NRRL Y-12695) TaxID=559304 RepID=G8YNI4_PICSO|nr:Piso0_001570 [Millerozyma farinosa CBS 7064]